MARSLAVALVLSCVAACASAQTQPAPGTAAAQAAPPAVKPAAKKPAPKSKAASKPAAPAGNGRCHIGVISAIGDLFALQKVGITVFGNEFAEAPIEAWGLDDLVVARMRAAVAPGIGVRKITYAKGTFAPYYDPPTIFRNAKDDLTAIVRQSTANSNCERYFVVTKITVKVDGTNQTVRGVGILNQGAGPFTRTTLFANFHVTVFDGQTFAIHKSPFSFGSLLAGSFTRTQEPLSELDKGSFPASAADAAASPMLRDRMRALLAARLDKTLPAYLKEE